MYFPIPTNNYWLRNRLDQLKEEKFLTNRMFKRISENMHYEIFKYVNSRDLLEIRGSTLGGFQLSSNKLLRSRIKNYIDKVHAKQMDNEIYDLNRDGNRVKVIFEQSGGTILDFFAIQKNDFEYWMSVLPQNPQIRVIRVGERMGQEIQIYQLLRNLYVLPKLHTLNLKRNKLRGKGLRLLATFLYQIPHLRKLNLSSNKLSTESIFTFVPYLKFISELENLNLGRNNKIGVQGLKVLAEHFRLIPNLRILKLETNKMDFLGMLALSINLEFIPKLEALNIGGNNKIGSTGLQALAKQLRYIPNLEKMNLNNNRFDSKGINAFAEHIKFTPNLKMLLLHHNDIGLGGIRTLAEEFRFIPNLQILDLLHTEIGESGMFYLCKELKYVPKLRILNLSTNKLGNYGLQSLARHLQYITKLQKLDISDNQVDASGVYYLGMYIYFLQNLEILNLKGNNLKYFEVRGLLDILPGIRLYVQSNQLKG